jgi:hypothetical protein
MTLPRGRQQAGGVTDLHHMLVIVVPSALLQSRTTLPTLGLGFYWIYYNLVLCNFLFPSRSVPPLVTGLIPQVMLADPAETERRYEITLQSPPRALR